MKAKIRTETTVQGFSGEMNATLPVSVPVLEIGLEAGESIFTEKGGMAWVHGPIRMDTGTRGGLLRGVTRRFSGESFFMTTYTCVGSRALVAFTPEVPGTIIPINLEVGQSVICQRDAFMVAQDTVELSIHFNRRLGAGLFGGEGFVLQRLEGPGMAWAEISGGVIEYTLKRGQTLKIDPGHVAMFEHTVDYDIARVKGVRNMLFGGEGLFLATLTGPGRVWLQTMPLRRLVAKLAQHMPRQAKSAKES